MADNKKRPTTFRGRPAVYHEDGSVSFKGKKGRAMGLDAETRKVRPAMTKRKKKG
jgi:hypothetical protein